MNKEIAELIVGYSDDLSLHKDYSGRGMYGKTTTAITGDSMNELMAAIGDCFYDMVLEAMSDGNDYDETNAVELTNVLSSIRQDSLGMGYIFY
jgi:hypothetical protein